MTEEPSHRLRFERLQIDPLNRIEGSDGLGGQDGVRLTASAQK